MALLSLVDFSRRLSLPVRFIFEASKETYLDLALLFCLNVLDCLLSGGLMLDCY